MKTPAALSFEASVALENISRGLRQARLARSETQRTAAARLGVGLATYQRIESGDGIAGVATGTVLTALCIYGFAADVVALGDPRRDIEGSRLAASRSRQRGARSASAGRGH